MSPETDPANSEVLYNCIALAAHDEKRWWQYDPDGDAGFETYWPEKVKVIGEVTVSTWIKLFEYLGFKRVKSARYEVGFEKVAIYAKGKEPTHVARQVGKHKWISKLGYGHDIQHRTLESLSGRTLDEYGGVVKILRRKL
jgi:hypothetical protein